MNNLIFTAILATQIMSAQPQPQTLNKLKFCQELGDFAQNVAIARDLKVPKQTLQIIILKQVELGNITKKFLIESVDGIFNSTLPSTELKIMYQNTCIQHFVLEIE